MSKISPSRYIKIIQSNKILGDYGEKIAAKYLKKQGCKVLYKKFNPRDFGAKGGEVDIVARDENTLVFIEVKTRSSYYKRAYDAVDKTKQSYIRKGAHYWLRELKQTVPHRFDIIEIYLTQQIGDDTVNTEVVWTKNAF